MPLGQDEPPERDAAQGLLDELRAQAALRAQDALPAQDGPPVADATAVLAADVSVLAVAVLPVRGGRAARVEDDLQASGAD